MKKDALKKLGKLLPIIGVVLLIYIIYSIGIGKIVDAFTKIPIHFYILASLPFFLRLALTAYKWQYISKKQKMNFSLSYLTKVILICNYYGNVTPGGFGWYIRIFYLRKKAKATIEKCITNSMIDTTTSFLVGLGIGLVGTYILIYYHPDIDYYPEIFYVILAFLIFYSVAFIVFMEKRGGKKIAGIFLRPLIPKKYKERLDKSVDAFYEDIPKFRDSIIPMLIEFAIWIIIAVQTYIIALAFSINVPFSTFFLIHTISVVAIGIIPVSVSGLGIREGAFMLLLLPFGVGADVAFVISFSGFIVKMLIPTILGMFFAFRMPVEKENGS